MWYLAHAKFCFHKYPLKVRLFHQLNRWFELEVRYKRLELSITSSALKQNLQPLKSNLYKPLIL
ncbi:hypothetical protein D1003_03215 [Riemerella anatipestifer]|nr:hypothetical protein [Riemerella anatipestifer]